MAEEFRDIQDENLKVNKEFYQVLQDAQTMGVSQQKLRKIMKDRGISSKNASRLLRGFNIPYSGYDGRMKKRVKDAQALSKEIGEGRINRNYFYPKAKFKQIEREYKRMRLLPEEPAPGLIERGVDRVQDLFSKAPQVQQDTQLADIQTPPLPSTPTPNVQMAQAKDPRTNLTRTESALLSPSEQIIASRT